MDVICPECGNEYSRIGHHWSMSSCDEPEPKDRQIEVIEGAMMGDASVTTSEGRKPYFSLEMVNKKFIQWVNEELGILSTGNIQHYENKKTSFGETETFRLTGRRMNFFNKYRDWYSTGEKRFPEDLELTPLKLKVWYCCDGGMTTDNRWNKKHYARITSKNEVDRKKKINSMFESFDFQPNWNDGCRFTFGREGSKKFWDYIGEPLPGFEYKWPEEFK